MKKAMKAHTENRPTQIKITGPGNDKLRPGQYWVADVEIFHRNPRTGKLRKVEAHYQFVHDVRAKARAAARAYGMRLKVDRPTNYVIDIVVRPCNDGCA